MKVAIFPGSKGLSIIYPAAGQLIEVVARKDTPPGVPYLIVEESTLPDDFTFQAAWEADFTKPTGRGIGPEAWFAEQAND